MFTAIVRFSIKKKLFVGLTTLFLFIGGIYAMLTLPIDAVPDITNNQVQIVTVSPTLAPQEVEQLITMPIEIAMSNIMNVEDIRSVSRFGLSVVTVVFKESVPTLDARQLINEQIQSVTSEIPSELGTPEMMPITTGLGEIYQYILKVAPGYEKKYDAMELRTIQHGQRLDIAGIIGARRRIADVADADGAAFFVGNAFFKYRADKAHAAVGVNIYAVGQGHAAAFLSAVLQGEQPPVNVAGNIQSFVKNT